MAYDIERIASRFAYALQSAADEARLTADRYRADNWEHACADWCAIAAALDAAAERIAAGDPHIVFIVRPYDRARKADC